MKNYDYWRDCSIRTKVYNALAEISAELDMSEEEMNRAIEWFQNKFYEEDHEDL